MIEDIASNLRKIVDNSVKSEAPTPAVPEPTELDKLAIKISLAHKDVVANARNMIVKAMDAGALLIQARLRVKPGTWMAWLQQNCSDISDRTARLYIQLAEGREIIEAQMKTGLATVANSPKEAPTFRQALERLKAGDDTNPETATETEEDTEADGEEDNEAETNDGVAADAVETLDEYDGLEEKLLAKLGDLTAAQAEEHSEITISKIKTQVGIMKKAAAKATMQNAA